LPLTEQSEYSGEVRKTSYVKILDINVDLLRAAANKDFMDELLHEVERKLTNLDDMKGVHYDKPGIIQLIKSITAVQNNLR
jgi:hypothetical protein